MKNNFIIFIIPAVLLFSVPACHSDHNHAHDDHQHEEQTIIGQEDHQEEKNEVELTQEQIGKVGLKWAPMEQKNLKSNLQVSGHLELPPQNKARVSALTEGRVINIQVRPGQFVKKNSVLLTLQHPDFIDWQQQYLEAKGQLIYLEKEYNRQMELIEKEVAAQKQFEKISAEKAIAEALLKSMKAKLNLVGIPLPKEGHSNLMTAVQVRSPISGYVRQIETNIGAYIQPEQELFEIVDNHHIHIDFLVYEKDIDKIEVGQKINFILQSKPSEVWEATIFAIGKALEEEQRAIKVHAEINNETGNLLPGMYVEGRIVVENKNVSALPEEAITLDKGLKYIFVKEEEHGEAVHFKKVQVLTGAADFGYVEVVPLEELAPDTEIVSKGAFFLMAQTKIGENGGGHHH